MPTNNGSPRIFSATCSNGIIINEGSSLLHVPILVSPKKIIVPVNHLSQNVTVSGPPLKRFSNGDSKTSFSYRAMASENSTGSGVSPRTLLIGSSTGTLNKPRITLHTNPNPSLARSCYQQGTAICSNPNCGIRNRTVSHCDSCKTMVNTSTISVIRPIHASTGTMVLGTKPNNTLPDNNSSGTKTITTVKSANRIRPSIISGAKSSCPTGISKNMFYGDKIAKSVETSPAHPIAVNKTKVCIETKTIVPKQTRTRKQPMKRNLEPECLTLSSDDEASHLSSQTSSESGVSNACQENLSSPSSVKARRKDGAESNNEKDIGSGTSSDPAPLNSECVPPCEVNSTTFNSDNISNNQDTSAGIRLMCRSIRIGSYKIQSQDPPSLALDISQNLIIFSVPISCDENTFAQITIAHNDLQSVLACFEKRLFVLFLYTSELCGCDIRSKLKMTKDTVYYDPSSLDETKKRITILPSNISDAEKSYLRKVFEKPSFTELSQSKANEILVRSTPVGAGGTQHMIRLSAAVITRSHTHPIEAASENEIQDEVVNLVTYPAAPQTGGITINTGDLLCLNEGEYLNDVIIDFYLKYIYLEKLSKEDQERTHIFSSFFFPRLTKTPIKNPTKNSVKISPKELRHSRVKTWTRHVDIFNKDFLIVPVNQDSHWFLVVICFPGRVSANYIPEPKDKKNDTKFEASIINTSNAEKTSLAANILAGDKTPIVENTTVVENTPVSDYTPYTGKTVIAEDQQDLRETDNADETVPDSTSTISQYAASASLQDSMNIHSTELNYRVAGETDLKAEENSLPSSTTQEHLNETMSQDKVHEKDEPKFISSNGNKVPCIMVFNSLPGTSHWRIVASLRDYLEIEHQVKKNTKKYFDRESMKGLNIRVPRQTNFSDCGVYLLQYAESFFKDPLESFTIPIKDLSNWFSSETINNKREELKNVIVSLAKRK